MSITATGFIPTGFEPGGFDPSGAASGGFDPVGFAPTGFAPTGFAPTGFFPVGDEPEGTLPPDLAGAITQRFDNSPGLTAIGNFTKMYHDQAGDKASRPYLIFTIRTGGAYLTTDTDYWHNDKVVFTAYADTQDQANDLRTLCQAAFGTGSYDYQTGFSIPFFQSNKGEGKEPGRAKLGTYVFKASLDYDARCLRY